ncbi:hypothetical protein BH24CHL7_BH24CHL7_06040 [soil metagenome]
MVCRQPCDCQADGLTALALRLPSDVSELTPVWLTAALRNGGVLEAGEVVAVSASVIGEELG